MTAQLGSIYDIPINVTDHSTDVGSSTMGESKMESSIKGGSSIHFSDTTGNFCQTEGATYKPPFKVFYTNSEQEVQHVSVNKFEGRSNYFAYYPSQDLAEQNLEQVWWRHQNKKLSDKRREEETAAYIREWCMARGRMETEIQRRKEHLNEATNFEKARGFVRTNWKTKNWNPNDDPTLADSSTDSEDADVIYKDENRDKVDDSMFGSPTKPPYSPNDSDRDRTPFSRDSN